MSQIRIVTPFVLFMLSPTTMNLPSGLKAMLRLLEGPRSVENSCPDWASQILIVLSLLPEARNCPSGLNARPQMPSLCPASDLVSALIATSQSRTTLS